MGLAVGSEAEEYAVAMSHGKKRTYLNKGEIRMENGMVLQSLENVEFSKFWKSSENTA